MRLSSRNLALYQQLTDVRDSEARFFGKPFKEVVPVNNASRGHAKPKYIY